MIISETSFLQLIWSNQDPDKCLVLRALKLPNLEQFLTDATVQTLSTGPFLVSPVHLGDTFLQPKLLGKG